MIAPLPETTPLPRDPRPSSSRATNAPSRAANAWRRGEAPARPALRLVERDGVLRPAAPLAEPSQAAVLAARLRAFPTARTRLEFTGVAWRPGTDESQDAYLNRMGTALMVQFRDTLGRESFDALYTLTRESVLTWIQGLLARGGGALDPQELLQDTFVNVYRYPHSFRDEHVGSFRVWVRTIAGNLVRRAGSRRQRHSFHALPEGLQEPADQTLNPATLVQAADDGRALRESWTLFLLLYAQAWKELSERDRRTLQLVEVDGLSYEEAGRALGVGRSNMKMIVFRSRKRIARCIERVLAAGRLGAAGLEVA